MSATETPPPDIAEQKRSDIISDICREIGDTPRGTVEAVFKAIDRRGLLRGSLVEAPPLDIAARIVPPIVARDPRRDPTGQHTAIAQVTILMSDYQVLPRCSR